jgi:aspartate aminotransferase-like enzyme
MPTDSLVRLRDALLETEHYGFEKARSHEMDLGQRVRALLKQNGFPSVAAAGFEAPGVVVSYTTDPDIQSSKKFLAAGVQSAAGVPLQCDEPADYRTFRLGLFGVEKWKDIDGAVRRLEDVLRKVKG